MINSNIRNIVVIGSSGAIGSAFVKCLATRYPDATINAFSRQLPLTAIQGVSYQQLDYGDELALADAAETCSTNGAIDMIIVAVGILHEGELMPEKSLRDLKPENFHQIFEVNTVIPAMIAKHFIPKLNRERTSYFAALSARVGSISDNIMGGWYSYRASKAALNMIIKNLAIEVARRNPNAIIVGLHPGTVDSNLSKPFQANVPKDKLFSPDYASASMLDVLEKLTPQQTGKFFAWDGEEILP